MVTAYKHGIRVTEINTGIRTIQAISTAIIGLLCTSTDADDEVFPLDKPVLVTDLSAAIAAAGTLGTLAPALKAISDQADAVIVVVRVATILDPEEQTAALIGTNVGGNATGMQAFLAAQGQLAVRPRIFGAPGLDTQAVTTAFVIVACKLGGMLYAECNDCDNVAEAITYRENFSDRELMLIWPDFTAFSVDDGLAGPGFAVARALGLRARIDYETGWHKTISNVAVAGVTGLSKDVHWDLQALDSEADLLNAQSITTLVNPGTGYRFWGSRTCSDEPLFSFESAVRTAQILKDTIAQGLQWAVDKPLHPSLAKDIIETINASFRSLKAAGYIIDGNAYIVDANNSVAALKNGQLTIDYDYTPVPPLEQLKLNQRITDRYLADFAQRV